VHTPLLLLLLLLLHLLSCHDQPLAADSSRQPVPLAPCCCRTKGNACEAAAASLPKPAA
jgi:hypothetical protein